MHRYLPTFQHLRLYLCDDYVYCNDEVYLSSEYGEHWHKSGIFEKRQNAYDDFIAAGEYLVKEKYTSTEKLV